MARILGDRYELGDRLAAGGMAEVFVAHDRRLDRRVAVKLLRTELTDPTMRARFELEALTAARISHPNVVAVHDVGEDGQRPYLVMELVEGESLATLMARRGPLPVDEAIGVAGEVLAGLGAAHAHGVVHRDVKPGNVLVAADGTVKLADFGIAKAATEAAAALTSTGQVVGTPTYLSPEQVRGLRATERSDVYAMGVVLYEMLAGAPPFSAETPVAVALAHLQRPVPPLRERCPDVPPTLAAVVERALAKEPSDRLAGADEMREALGALDGRAPDHDQPDHADEAVTRPMAPLAPTLADERPAPSEAATAGRRRRFVPVAAALGLAAALVAGLLLVLPRDGGGGGGGGTVPATAVGTPQEGEPPVTESPAGEPPATAPPATEIPEPDAGEPETIGELVALVAQDPGGFGEKGRDLADDLLELQEEDADERPQEAAKLVREVEKWVREGELDPGIGALAVRLLTPLADSRGRG